MNSNINEERQSKELIIVNNLLNRSTKETVALIKEAIESGESDPAYVGVVLKKFAKVQELVKANKNLQSTIDSETRKYQQGNAKTFTLHGAKITVANTGFWDYNQTKDPLLEKLMEIEELVKIQLKLRREELQAKAIAWESKNSPGNIVKFGLKPFTVAWQQLPELIWEDAEGEVDTSPPIKRGQETLRYSL